MKHIYKPFNLLHLIFSAFGTFNLVLWVTLCRCLIPLFWELEPLHKIFSSPVNSYSDQFIPDLKSLFLIVTPKKSISKREKLATFSRFKFCVGKNMFVDIQV